MALSCVFITATTYPKACAPCIGEEKEFYGTLSPQHGVPLVSKCLVAGALSQPRRLSGVAFIRVEKLLGIDEELLGLFLVLPLRCGICTSRIPA